MVFPYYIPLEGLFQSTGVWGVQCDMWVKNLINHLPHQGTVRSVNMPIKSDLLKEINFSNAP